MRIHLVFQILFQVTRTIVLQKRKICIKNFFTKCDRIRGFLRIWSRIFREEILNGILLFLCSAFKIDLEISCLQMIVRQNNLKKVKFLREFKGSQFLSSMYITISSKPIFELQAFTKTSKSIFSGTYCEDIFKRFLSKQKQDGSFGTLQETTFIVKASSGKSILDIKNNACPMTQGK